jgi:hypothetical protein
VPNIESLVTEGKLAEKDQMLQSLGVAGALELFHLTGKVPEALLKKGETPVASESNPEIEAKVATQINDIRAGSAFNNFMKAPPEVIDNLVKSDQTAQNMNLTAMDAVKRAEEMPDGEEKVKALQSASDLTQAADIKHITEMIAESPDGLSHMAEELPQEIRDEFMQKAQAIYSSLNPTEVQKQSNVDNIAQAESVIKQFEPLASPNNPNVKERLEAQIELDRAKAAIDESTKNYKETTAQQEALRQALQESKLASGEKIIPVIDERGEVEGAYKVPVSDERTFITGKDYKAEVDEKIGWKSFEQKPTEVKPTEVKPITPELKEGEVVKFKTPQGNTLEGEKVEIPGYEDMDMILVKDGFENRIYELTSGIEIGNTGSAFSKQDAVSALRNQLLEKNVSSEKIKNKLFKEKSLQINPSNKFESYAEDRTTRERADYESLPLKYTPDEIKKLTELRNKAIDLGIDSRAKELEDAISSRAKEGTYKGSTEFFEKMLQKDIDRKIKKEAEDKKVPYPEEYIEKYPKVTEDYLKTMVNSGYKVDKFSRIPDDIKKIMIDGLQLSRDFVNKYGYHPSEKSDVFFTKLLYFMNSLGAQKNKEIRRETGEKELMDAFDDLKKVHEKEFGKTQQEGEVKTYNAKDLKENPEILEEDKNYHTLTYPKSFVRLSTNMRALKSSGFENAKIGDVINIFKKDYVIDGFLENKKNPNETKVLMIRVDKDGNLLREQNLSKKEQEEGRAKEFEEEEIGEEIIEEANKLTQDDLKKAEAKFATAKDRFEKAKAKIEASQVTQRGMFGGEQKGMFAMGGEEAKSTLYPLRIAVKEAKAELDDIKNRIKVQEEAQAELMPIEEAKQFKSSQGHIVEFKNGKLIVKNKEGEVLSDRASKKAIEDYADNFDYEKGDKVEEIPDEITNARDAAKYVIDESSNPAQIAEIYSSEDLMPKESNAKFQAIAEHGLGRIKTSSYKMFGDVNNIEKSMYLKIFSQEKGLPIDVVAKSISDKYEGLNIEPKDIVEYIEKYSKGDKAVLEFEDSDVARQAKDKFKELTGLDLTPELANKILDKQLEKANQDQLDIIKEDYETAKQLEDAYWAAEKGTDGFTKESPVSKINEPKEATKESVVEEPEGRTTSIKNRITAQERADKGLSEIEVTAKRSFGEVFEKGKTLVDEGKVDARQMAKDLVQKPKALSPEESVALLYDRMKIQNEYKKLSADIENEPDGIVKDMMRSKLDQLEQDALTNDEAARKTGYEQGLGLAVRKMIIKEDYSLLNQINKYKAANKGEELTPEIKKKLEENVSKLEEAEKKLEEYEQTIKDLQAKKTIDTEAKKTKKLNKTSEDFKKEREDIFKNIKDKWDSASKSNIVTAVPVPYAAQLAAISPEVLKLVKSYAEQGIVKLDDIVDDLHENISKQIPQITKRDVKDILAGEYTKEREKKAPTVDREKMRLQANVNKIKNQIDLEKQEIERSKQSNLRKGVDLFQKWRRFTLLSGIPVLGKIGLSGGLRATVTTPLEALIGKGLSKLPGVSRIAAMAPREGSFNPKAEAKGFAQMVDKATYQDVRQVLKTGRGELEYLHDKKLYPSDGWLDFFGQLHAAIKVVPKRAEYFRALEYRTESAIKNGKDISDPIVQQEVSAGAYSDALRTIYMQENAVTDLYKTGVRKLESLGGLGKAGAEALKFILPIIKVPTNFVAEESSYILGAVKAAFALRKGISKLSPQEADYVMRALKKQGAGVGFLMMGYARPDLVGGYYTGPRKKDDLKAGDLIVAGVHMPHWALHTPMLEALQFGATIRRARDAAGKSYKQKDLNMFTGVVPAIGAVGRQIPFSQQAEQLTRAFSGNDAFLKYAGGQAQSVIDPQLIKNIAEFTDYTNGKWNKREAKTFEEKLKAGFPGTRQQLKIKKE